MPLFPVHSTTMFGGQTTAGSSVSSIEMGGERAKKMFPTESMRSRAFALRTAGTDTLCDPSLGVPLARRVGKLRPPSVESRMFTVGATLPPPTSHVTLLELPHSSFPPAPG